MLNIESFSQKFELVRWNFEIITSNWLKDENNVGFVCFFFCFFSNGGNKLPYLSHILLSVFNSLKFLVIISKFDLTVSNIWENNMKFQVVMLEFWENIQKFGDYYLKISGYYHKILDYGWGGKKIFFSDRKSFCWVWFYIYYGSLFLPLESQKFGLLSQNFNFLTQT